MRYGDASRNKPHIATRRTQAQHLVINPAGLLAGSPTGRTAGGTMSIHRTITVAQGKGGVGKTSLVSNIGGLTAAAGNRSEEHPSELQSLMRIPYAVFCLKK